MKERIVRRVSPATRPVGGGALTAVRRKPPQAPQSRVHGDCSPQPELNPRRRGGKMIREMIR
jgi:hypothetical protein